MKFSEDMIGKRVREISTGDEGTVLERRVFKLGSEPLPSDHIAVMWDNDGALSIRLDAVVFLNYEQYQEITIDGKRYKLVPLEEE